MKRRRRIRVLVGLTLVAAASMLLVLVPAPKQGSVSVRLVAFTNDAGGTRFALFSAKNTTDRLFVRGRSEVESRRETSSVISVVQITNVDYLRPGQTIDFAMPCDQLAPWRLKFYYVGQFHLRESIVYESSWSLRRTGLLPKRMSSMSWLPQHQVYEFATEWVGDADNVQPGGAANGSQPIRSETKGTSPAAGSRR